MGAITQIAIQDGKAVPEYHYFNPIQSVPPMYAENDIVDVPELGEPKLTLDIKRATGNGNVHKVMLNMSIPVLETPSGGTPAGYTAPPGVAYTLRSKHEFFLPVRSTDAQRKDLRALARALLGHGTVLTLLENLEKPY